MSTIQINDPVMYSAGFVRNCGGYSKTLADKRGVVVHVTALSAKNSIADVQWEDSDDLKRVLTSNLVHADKPELA